MVLAVRLYFAERWSPGGLHADSPQQLQLAAIARSFTVPRRDPGDPRDHRATTRARPRRVASRAAAGSTSPPGSPGGIHAYCAARAAGPRTLHRVGIGQTDYWPCAATGSGVQGSAQAPRSPCGTIRAPISRAGGHRTEEKADPLAAWTRGRESEP